MWLKKGVIAIGFPEYFRNSVNFIPKSRWLLEYSISPLGF
jgi:hypothetical protein